MSKRIIPTGAQFFFEPFAQVVKCADFSGTISLPDGDYALSPSNYIFPEFMHPETILILSNVNHHSSLDERIPETLKALIIDRCPYAYKEYADRHYRKFPDSKEHSEDIIQKSALMHYYWMCADPKDRAKLIAPLAQAGASFMTHYARDITRPKKYDMYVGRNIFFGYDPDVKITLYDGILFHHYTVSESE